MKIKYDLAVLLLSVKYSGSSEFVLQLLLQKIIKLFDDQKHDIFVHIVPSAGDHCATIATCRVSCA